MKKIKICGLKRREDIEYVNKYQPDYIGFVFAGKKRKLTYDQVVDLKKYLTSSIQVVGVFVNEDIFFVEKLVKEHVIDLVQLHGQEDQKYIQALKEKVDVSIIKAIQIKNEDSFNEHYDVDYYLYDHGTGGTGESFDWSMLKEVDKPVFLAGGINLLNIDDALKKNVYALDVSSGVETDGFKDEKKIKKIVRRVRNEG
ncbi:phosphoribosylanthranilate isomerase [Faecalibacillus faecis]|jgi:phosphoribosylanthranilate isomerase|uniref:phosphoribosylanthranilate isomerase n=1 Tax=Faecalibacillus faecis TaxID=1982628 RepID=UPI0032BF8CC3